MKVDKTVIIKIGELRFKAGLYPGAASAHLYSRLPLEVEANRWGDEYYGDCGLDLPPAPERELMEIGELAYWPPGRALCVFFGPTPASVDDQPRAASPVIPLGKLEGDCSPLKRLGREVKIRLGTG